jgi:hypothetical protein
MDDRRPKRKKGAGSSNVMGFTPVIEEHTRALGPSLETAAVRFIPFISVPCVQLD